MKVPDTEFALNARVWITNLETWGRIAAFFYDERGWQYYVRYFFNGEARDVYFFKDELKDAKP